MSYDNSLLNYQVRDYDAIEQQMPSLIQPRSKASQFFSVMAQIFMYPFTACCTCYTLKPRENSIISSCGQPVRVKTEPGIHGKFFWETALKISTAVQDLPLKETVNDQKKNPIIASAVVYWKVCDVAKFQFESMNSTRLLKDQAIVTLREVCANHPFDSENEAECLGKPTERMAQELKTKLQNKISKYGIEIDSFQFTDVCYIPALQETLLQKQKMEALVNAKEQMTHTISDITTKTLEYVEKGLNVQFSDEEKKQFALKLLITGSNFSQTGNHTLNLNNL